MIRFREYLGQDLMGLPTSKNHLNFEWLEPETRILFSVCQQGEAASCHFASNKKSLRRLREAINQFVAFVFWLFDWCKMIIGKVIKESVGALLIDCGFVRVANYRNFTLMERAR